MTAFNPIAAMNRLKAAGITAKQAEALADEMANARTDIVTRDELRAELSAMSDRLTLRLGGVMAVLLGLAVAFLALI